MAYAERRHPGYGRDGKRLHYIQDMSAGAIEQELISDGIAGFETRLPRYVAGIAEIAHQTGGSAEDIHSAIVNEVTKHGAVMPGMGVGE